MVKLSYHCRAYPDEKGIETRRKPACHRTGFVYCRAYPDEKGIETLLEQRALQELPDIAEPIPMKRELKPTEAQNATSHLTGLQSLSR